MSQASSLEFYSISQRAKAHELLANYNPALELIEQATCLAIISHVM